MKRARLNEVGKVVHVITGLRQGGAETALFRLLGAQQDRARFHVISLMDSGVFGERLAAIGVRVSTLGLKTGLGAPLALYRLVRLLRALKPDVVQTWMYHADLLGGLAARVLGVPVCWGLRHSNLDTRYNKAGRLAVVRACAALSRFVPATIVSCSRRAAENHLRFGFADKFEIIPNGIDVSEVRPRKGVRDMIRRELEVADRDLIVGHISRDDPQKDHKTLLNVFSRVAAVEPRAKLLLAGRGLEWGHPYLEGLIGGSSLRPRIIALGPRSDVPRLMLAMDLFLLTSVGEGFPNVVAEAMACGVRCVLTDVGDAKELVGRAGWVRPAEDAEGLASDVLSALWEAPRDRQARESALRERIVSNYSISAMVERFDDVWLRARDEGCGSCRRTRSATKDKPCK